MYTDSKFTVFFGNKQTGISFQEYKQAYESKGAKLPQGMSECQKVVCPQRIIFLRQIHSTTGVIITESSLNSINSFAVEGDFLVTNLPGIALGIFTADCLPIIIYDPYKHVISAIHAGWRGSVAGIAAKAVGIMQESFSCNTDDLQIYAGPSAKNCCYAVDDTFISQLKKASWTNDCITWKDNKPFFDIVGYNQKLLMESGISPSVWNVDYSFCTICNLEYYSYRREKDQSGRQLSVAMLR